MKFIFTIILLLSINARGDDYATFGYEFMSGKEESSDGNTGLFKFSYMNNFSGPLFLGGDLAFNIEQLVLDDVKSRRFEHEAYLNLNAGVVNKISNKIMAYAYVGANIARLERDLPSGINKEEDTTEVGHVIGAGVGFRISSKSTLTLGLSRIDNGDDFVFTGMSINLTGISSLVGKYL
ncbi:hypothetical protein [Oceanicoccus sp. KOV_DT_Chl]|uniref:hypothetical protein n=1 Tax=Oceanicoccus sp. KOV_DT_Chl TaxID=1904639 RepID=UPI000C7AEB5E|nr:hypothetical protein [Oceanicoccus sp. KOV_DT_Chl]